MAELFIFLRTLHTPIALDISVHITTLNRLRQLHPGDTLNQKVCDSVIEDCQAIYHFTVGPRLTVYVGTTTRNAVRNTG